MRLVILFLFGIVIGFIIVKDVNSPLLIILAALTGVFTSWLIELLVKSRRVSEEAATGVVFPLLFAISIILISSDYLKGAHIGPDTTFLGQHELAPIKTITIGNLTLPSSLFYALILLVIVTIFVILFYKELKIVAFDPVFARVTGVAITLIHYLLMSLVSITAVVAFDIMGAIMIISLMVGPAATALLVTKKLHQTIFVAIGVGLFNVLAGVILGVVLNLEISALIALITMIIFLILLLVNPKSGLIDRTINRNELKKIYALIALVMHLGRHYKNKQINTSVIAKELQWSLTKTEAILTSAFKGEYIIEKQSKIRVTPKFAELCAIYT